MKETGLTLLKHSKVYVRLFFAFNSTKKCFVRKYWLFKKYQPNLHTHNKND